jgi:hypothetical protein
VRCDAPPILDERQAQMAAQGIGAVVGMDQQALTLE